MGTSSATIMRRVSGVLYGILGLFSLFMFSTIMQGAAFGDLPLANLADVAFIVLIIVAAISILSKDGEIKSSSRRVLVFATIIYIAYNLMTYKTEVFGIQYFFQYFGFTEYGFFDLICFAVKLLIALLAAFFATMSVEKNSEISEKLIEEVLEETGENLEVSVEKIEEVEEK